VNETNESREIAARHLPLHDELENCRRRLRIALHSAMNDRPAFNGLGWIEHEREAITQAANMWALARGLPTVTVDQVEQVEQRAVGHCDYSSKFALYVCELVYGLGAQP
jgi:hypothetical protein